MRTRPGAVGPLLDRPDQDADSHTVPSLEAEAAERVAGLVFGRQADVSR